MGEKSLVASWREILDGQVESSADWDSYFTDHPDVLHDLLVDLHKAAHGTKPATLDSLWNMLAPRFTNDPFEVAVRALLVERQRSLTWLAKNIGIVRPVLMRWLEQPISHVHPEDSSARIEVVAKLLKVHPSYFAEWRRLWFMRLLDVTFTAKPNLSASLYPKYAEHEIGATPMLVTHVQEK